LRIIAGDLKGKKLFSIKGQTTRPTSDRLRESIFNILSNRPSDAFVLDLFAGTGALGIEAISRGALLSYFIDNKAEAISVIRKNITACKVENKSVIFQWDITKNLRCIETLKNKINLVFMDPPYNTNLIKVSLINLQQSGCLQAGACIVVEHSLYETLPCNLDFVSVIDQRKYSKTFLSILTYDI
jgi:16S rRNA (guanine966-N2)-methyltransferase